MRQRALLILVVILLFLMVAPVQAHVKWFTEFSFLDQPLSLGEALSPLFIGFAVASTLGVVALVFVDKRLENLPFYLRIREWLQSRRDSGTLVLRIGMGATLLLSWQADTLLAPYLEAAPAVGWFQFLLVLLLLFPQTTPLAGAGTLVLWVIGLFDFGVFYMLDYMSFVGIGVWLLLSQAKSVPVRELGIPALYFTVGFALIWLAMEKVIYPDWGIAILRENPQLTLGFPADFFLVGAAFVEFVLGYLLIIGLLGRPLGLVITLVFFTTTLVFGKVEVIGHTHLHAALIVFLLYGPGRYYPAPINIHSRMNWRMAFAGVNFVLLLSLFMVIYSFSARNTYEHLISENITSEVVEDCQAQIAASGEDPASIFIEIRDQDVPCDVILEIGPQG